MKTKSLLVLGAIIIVHLSVKGQVKIGTNPTSINSNSLLELESGTQGFVLPRVSIGDVSAASPLTSTMITGTIVYNTNSTTTGGSGTGIYLWDGTKWVFISTGTAVSSSAWLLTGNSGLSSSTNFIGTTDAIDFVVKTANTERMRILGAVNGSSKAGWVGIGVTVPRSSLDVTGHYTNKNVITIQNSSTSGFSSVDMLDSAGNLSGTFGYANLGTGGSFGGKDYFNGYGNDFLFTRGSSYDLLMKGSNGYIGLNTGTPSERLHVVGNIYLNGAFMPGGTAGTSGYILTSAGAGISPTWTSSNSLAWALTGNSGTSYATNFLGTTDNVSMRFRTNNVQRMIIDSLGKVGIGLSNPAYALSVLSASNPLYLSGVQTTTTFAADSILTINGGIVKKTPYSTLNNVSWNLPGNSGTNSSINFLGTTDNHPLKFKVNNTIAGFIDSSGGLGNTYFGNNAGYSNTTGSGNTLAGSGADSANSTGTSNTALGYQAGYNNTSGGSNTFTGYQSGYSNTTASGNLFSGFQAGYKNTTGQLNMFSGYWAGYSNTTGSNNVFTGYLSGFGNTTGGNNIFIGSQAGSTNTTGSRNTLIGGNSNVLTAGLFNAAAIGYSAKVGLSNSLVLGDTISGGNAVNVGIGVRYPLKRLHIDAAPISIFATGTQDSLKIDNLASSLSAYNKAILVIDSATGYVSKQNLSNLSSNINWSLNGNSGTNYTTNFLGTTDSASMRFRTANTQRMIIDSLGNVGIGDASSNFNPGNPARLLVDNSETTSNTIAYLKGSIDDYLQINLRNKSNGGNASTDYIATADDGTDSTYYVDMGINSSNYAFSADNWGQAHDAYLYSNSKNLYIGTQANNSDVIFLVGGGRAVTNAALRIRGNTGNVVIGKGDVSTTPIGNVLRGPNGFGANIAGGNLTIQGGAGTGTAAAGNLLLNGGITPAGSNGTINFSTSSAERMRIDASGNLGIGTTNPSNLLSVIAASNPLYLSGVQATSTFTADSLLTINAGVVKKAPYSAINSATTNTLTLNTNTLTSTVNGVAATSNAVSAVSNTSIANILSTTVNGVTGTTVPIINSNIKTWTQSGGLTTTINGISSNVTPAGGSVNTILGYDASGVPVYQSLGNINLSTAWNVTGNSGTTAGTNYIGTTDNVDFVTKTSGIERMRVLANGRVGIGLTNPSYPLAVKDTMEIRRVGSLSTLLFTNTSGSGDFRIGGDGGDIFWQGGGGRALQMGSYWTTIIGGDRQTSAYPAFINSLTGTSVLVQGQRDVSVPLGIQGYSTSQSANLTEWRNSSGAALSVINKNGYMGIGITNPPNALSVLSGSNPLYLSGVQATSTLTLDSLLTINAGVVKKTSYSALTGATTNILTLSTNTLTSTVNGVTAMSSAVSGVNNTSNANTLSTTVNGVTSAAVPIINTNTNALTQAGGLVTTVNGVAATTSIPTGTVSNVLGYNAAGAPVYQPLSNINLSSAWNILGNSGTNASTNFIGTTDGNDFVTRTNNTERMRVTSAGSVGIGVTNPQQALSIGNGMSIDQNDANNGVVNANALTFGSNSGEGIASKRTLNGNHWGLDFYTNGYNRMSITNGGFMGVGTTNPSNVLTVLGTNPLYLGGVQATTTFGSDSILTINAGIVKKASFAALSSSTTNTLSLSGNTLTSTVNGVAATSNAVSSVSNTSSANTLSTTINGVAGATAPIINTNTNALTQAGGLVNTVNGVAATTSIASGTVTNILGYNTSGTAVYQPLNNLNLSSAWNITGNSSTSGSNFLGTTDNISMRFRTNNVQRMIIDSLGRVGIGISIPISDLTIYQSAGSAGNSKGFTFTGNSISGVSSGTGVLMTLGYNAAGNKQLWFGDGDYAGNASGSFARFVANGTNFPTFDAVSGDGASRRYLALGVAGDPNSGVIFGTDNTGTNPGSLVWGNGNMSIGAGYKSAAAPSNGLLVQGNVGIGTTAPSSALSVIASSNPMYMSGLTALTSFSSTDSVLTISSGTVKKAPYTLLAGSGSASSGWALAGNSITSGQFLGTTNAQALVLKANNVQMGYFDGNVSSLALGVGASNASSDHNVAIGYNAYTNNQYTLALGYTAQATGVRSIAIGNGASATTASGSEAVAIGYNANANNVQTVAMGYQAQATGQYGLALGYNPTASGIQSVAIGYQAQATQQYSSALGYQAQATGSSSTAIGYLAQTSQSNTILLGNVSTNNLYVGIGTSTPSAKLDIVANSGFNPLELHGLPTGTAGTDNILTVNSSGVVGYVTPSTFNTNYWSLSGNAATSGSYLGTTNTTPLQFKFNSTSAGYIDANNTALGTSSVSTSGTSNTAIGYSANAANSATAVGASSVAANAANTAIGNNATANNSDHETAIGASAQANAQYNTALGYYAQAISNSQATAVGTGATATGYQSTALGVNAQAINNAQTTALGVNATANAQYNTAVGFAAQAISNSQGTAVGYNSKSTSQYGVALGYNAQAINNSQTTAVGSSTVASGATSSAFGYDANATAAQTTSIGGESDATSQSNTAVGYNAQATNNTQATAIGAGTSATGSNSTAIGYGATTSQNNALILGNTSANVGIGTSTPNTGAKLDVAGTFKLGSTGSVLNSMIKGTVTTNIGAIPIGGTSSTTFTVPNAIVGAIVGVSPKAALPYSVVIGYAYVSSANTVTITFGVGGTATSGFSTTLDVSVLQ